MDAQRDLATAIVREHEQMKADRQNFTSHWQEIADRVYPAASKRISGNGMESKGDKRNLELYDSTAAIACQRFSAILDSLLTPRNQTWHKLTSNNDYVNKDRKVQLWFEQVTKLLFKYRYSPKANYSAQNQQTYMSLGAFGTGCMFVDQLAGDVGIRYRNIHIGELYIAENHQGVIDKLHREFRLTARQALQRFGQKCPEQIKDAMKNNPEKEFTFIHCVKPNDEYDEARLDYGGMPFASYYVSIDGKQVVDRGGYRVFPYAVSRYTQMPGEVYGRSPAMEVLPAIKTLNEMKKTILKQGHRAVDPVLFIHDNGMLDAPSLKPGAINPGGVSADGRPLIHTLPVGNIMLGKELMDDERQPINDAFLVNLFQVLVDSPQMTATEVLERAKEKGILLAPTVGRQQDEYLGPKIERELDVMARQFDPYTGQPILPPMPELLLEAHGEYEIIYDSPLSRAQKADEAVGFARTLETALRVAEVTQNQEPLDHFDWDVIVPEVAAIQGMPARWMRDPKVVSQMRDGRAQAAQQAQETQAMPAMAAAMKDMAIAGKQ